MNRHFIISFSPKFIRLSSKLRAPLQDKVEETIEELQFEGNHKKLKVHKLKGRFKDKYSYSLDYKNRVVFEYLTDEEIVLLAVGCHDVYSRDM